jgi:hypothetical protein
MNILIDNIFYYQVTIRVPEKVLDLKAAIWEVSIAYHKTLFTMHIYGLNKSILRIV